MKRDFKLRFWIFLTVLVLSLAISNGLPLSADTSLAVTNITQNGDLLQAQLGEATVEIQICAANIVKVKYLPEGISTPATPVIRERTWNKVNAGVSLQPDEVQVKTTAMSVKIAKNPFNVTVYDPTGRLLIKQKAPDLNDLSGVKFIHNQADNLYGINGYGLFDDISGGIVRNDGGEVKAGEQGNCGGPLVWSTGGYGVIVDSDGGQFINDRDVLEFAGGSRKDIEYYVLVGNPTQIMTAVGEVSGKPPLFPKWALGFMNSQWGIEQDELLEIVDTYRSKNIPIDLYILDFDWKAWGEDNYGEWSWNPQNFPDGSSGKLKKILDVKGIKLAGIMKPRIHRNTVQGQYVTDHDFWYPGKTDYCDYASQDMVGDINFNTPECAKWYWSNIKNAYDTGIVGFWNDEADVGFDNFSHFKMAQSLYEWQRSCNNKRVWSLNRNFYLGAQRYAYAMWSGDIRTGFHSMAAQRARMLSTINLGQVKWGMDSGGFIGHPSPENYARWVQFSAFTPVFRVHGAQNERRQPWAYGPKAESVAKAAIQLRYKLIPYIYAYERKAYQTGIGLVRPLCYDYPGDPKVANYIDAWMFGDYLLAAPVVNEGQKSKNIYLPAGEWIDYFKGKSYTGGQVINYAVDSENWSDIPLFVKKGAIIPTQTVMNYIGEKPVDLIALDVFAGDAVASFNYYDDDGETYNYEKGVYFSQELTVQNQAGSGVAFKASNKTGSYLSNLKYYLIKLHSIQGKTVTQNGLKMARKENLQVLKDFQGEGWTVGKDLYGDVTFIKIAAGVAREIMVK